MNTTNVSGSNKVLLCKKDKVDSRKIAKGLRNDFVLTVFAAYAFNLGYNPTLVTY